MGAMIGLTILAKDTTTRARIGRLKTPHGDVQTPVFMPVGTKGAVKTLSPSQLSEIGVEIILGNTYHLMQRPGINVIELMGGLHKFMSWNKPILTDSGGYQVFSLAKLVQVSDEGVLFKSHIDGTKIFATPQDIIKEEETLGADIIMPLDEPIPYPNKKSKARECMERTHLWFTRSLRAKNNNQQALFAIIQGSIYEDLRCESVEKALEHKIDGFAIGGLSMGEPKEKTFEIIDLVCKLLPEDKPRYLMGIGKPSDIIKAVSLGIDMFDCILPTRLGRNGWAFGSDGIIRLKNRCYQLDKRPLDENCNCFVCRNFTKAYIRHIYLGEEVLALTLLSYHNVYYYIRFIQKIRNAILDGSFPSLLKDVQEF
jgi:queuine tRNA-ribosyltransferase